MSEFRIFETDRFVADLERISPARRDKIVQKLRAFVYPRLREQPCFGPNIRKLKGFRPETWRYRIGGYRFFYIVDDKEKTVSMVAADTRQQSY
ncbi:MAG: type II toxin-antitoxin system RelE/ParE family toxin [Candidatus Aminicenantes bacterium]|nr:MAG: type II toxin-antitoxin system RelE/ParE family toxin [Candidatus Aminicenantes bacterium]